MLYKEYDSCDNLKDMLLVDIYKSIINIANINTTISHYRGEIKESDILAEYIKILDEIDTKHDKFRNIRLFIVKSKGDFLNVMNEITYRQGRMNIAVHNVAYELDTNRGKYLANVKRMHIKLRESSSGL